MKKIRAATGKNPVLSRKGAISIRDILMKQYGNVLL
jgi:hypothetical protein